jgi:hypothetical protein
MLGTTGQAGAVPPVLVPAAGHGILEAFSFTGTKGGATGGCLAVVPVRHWRYHRLGLPRAPSCFSPFFLFIYFLLPFFDTIFSSFFLFIYFLLPFFDTSRVLEYK